MPHQRLLHLGTRCNQNLSSFHCLPIYKGQMCLSLSKASVPQIQVKFWIRKLPMLPDLGDSAKVHKEWTKVFVRNIVVEAIRALLTPLLLTGWRPNEHPAKMEMSETTLNDQVIGLWSESFSISNDQLIKKRSNCQPVLSWSVARCTSLSASTTSIGSASINTNLSHLNLTTGLFVYLFWTVLDILKWDTTCFPSTQWGAELKQSSRLDTDVKVAKLTKRNLFPGHQ